MKNFNIIGIAVETTNQRNQAATDLGKLWNRFYTEEIFNKIPNKEGEEVYAIYTDYESDYTGKYTSIIGQRVRTLELVPEGMTGRSIQNEKLMKYTAKGEMPMSIVDTWKEIWEKDAILNRSYVADFEVYGAKAQQGSDSEVDIFVGIH